MRCRRSSVVELQLPKLITRVRFPSLAPYCNYKVDTSYQPFILLKYTKIALFKALLLIFLCFV